mmetsp:Transcript_49477/g.142345  ORF Transcript_49477/g.142345 Transcript_49477/m.142345 type:complete len:466 (-) Transcript_49477:780-2177(-)
MQLVRAAPPQCHGLDVRALDAPGVVLQHSEVVQRVHVDAVRRHGARGAEGQEAVAEGARRGIAVADDKAALGVDDHAGACELHLGHTVDGQGHGHSYLDEGPGQLLLHRVAPAGRPRPATARRRRNVVAAVALALVALLADFRYSRPRRRGRRRRPRPPSAKVRDVPGGELHGEPRAVDAHHGHRVLRGAPQVRVPHRHAGGVGISGEGLLQRLQAPGGPPPDVGDEGAGGDARAPQEVALRGHEDADALHREVVVPSLLVGQVVEDRVAALQVCVGDDAVQVLHPQHHPQQLTPPLHKQLQALPDAIVENLFQRHESRDPRAVNGDQHVPRLQQSERRSFRHQRLHDEHADVLSPRPGCLRLGVRKTQAPQIRKGRKVEGRLEGTPSHLPPAAQQVHGTLDPVERKGIRGGGANLAGGVQRHDIAIRIHNGRARRAAGSRGRRLEVEGVEVVVALPPVERRLPI